MHEDGSARSHDTASRPRADWEPAGRSQPRPTPPARRPVGRTSAGLLAGADLIMVDVIEVPMARLTDKRGGERKEADENGNRAAHKARAVDQHDGRIR